MEVALAPPTAKKSWKYVREIFLWTSMLLVVVTLCVVNAIIVVNNNRNIQVIMANVRKDIRADTLTVRESIRLPPTQTLLQGAISYNPGTNAVQYSNGSQVFD